MVSPTAPQDAQEADQADPGEMSEIKADQRQTQTGKYGSTPVQAYKPASASSDSSGDAQNPEAADPKKHWIEIQLLDEADKPVAGESYRITLPDGTVDDGTLDGQGLARVEGIDPGSCTITFPKRDQAAWQPL